MAFKRKRGSSSYGARKRMRSFRRRRQRRFAPSRLYGRKTLDRTSRIVNKTLRAISESKLRGLEFSNEYATQSVTGTNITLQAWNLGEQSTLLAAPFTPLNAFEYPQGDGSTERVGRYMYLRHSRVKFLIQMNEGLSDGPNGIHSPNTQFRFMVVKARRSRNKYNQSPAPSGSLMLDNDGTEFGYTSTGISKFKHMTQPINKRRWITYMDKRFTLATPVSRGQDPPPQQDPTLFPFTNSKYRNSKIITFKAPFNVKTSFGSSNTPQDIDTQFMFLLYAANTDYNSDTERANRFNVSMIGTTCALDN